MELKVNANESLVECEKVDGNEVFRFKPNSRGKAFAYYRVKSDMFRNGRSPEVNLTLVYFDKGKGNVSLVYDSSDEKFKQGKLTAGVWKGGGVLKLTNTSTWRQVSFKINDARFSGKCNGYDLRFQADTTILLGGLYVAKGNGD